MNDTVVQTQSKSAKTKQQSTDLIAEVGTEIEQLSKADALSLADQLVTDIDTNSFRLGGVLTLISENSWIDGYESFGDFVLDKYGFREGKANYLMRIYQHLVTEQIPWSKVSHLGWCKLRELVRVINHDNVDEWVAKVENLSFTQLQAMLSEQPDAEGKSKKKDASSDSHKLNFTLKADQLDVVQQALAKAKGESGTEYDSVALELICTGYLGNAIEAPAITELLKGIGWEKALEAIESIIPDNVTVNVSVK